MGGNSSTLSTSQEQSRARLLSSSSDTSSPTLTDSPLQCLRPYLLSGIEQEVGHGSCICAVVNSRRGSGHITALLPNSILKQYFTTVAVRKDGKSSMIGCYVINVGRLRTISRQVRRILLT